MTGNPIVPVSESLSKSLKQLFDTGGFALAFGFGGLLVIIISNVAADELVVPMFIAGCALTFICLFTFLFGSLRVRRATKRIEEDLPLLDALQHTAFQATELASVTQSFAFKHLEKVQSAIDAVSPLIESLPVVGPAAKKSGLTDSGKVSAVIVAATEGTKETVFRLQEAIRTGDLKEIQKYGRQLEMVLVELKNALGTEEDE